jgi:hypothetical protein
LPDLLAKMLDGVAGYAVSILSGVVDRQSEGVEARITAARRNAGIGLGEAEDSLERLLAEPRHDTGAEEYALQLITYARRASGALTTIDTYAARGLTAESALGPELAHAVEAYVVETLHQAAAFARGAQPGPDASLPELPDKLDARLHATLARLLRGARLLADVSRGGL